LSALARVLWAQRDGRRFEYQQSELLGLAQAVIVLGEAGMGKTTLLRALAESNVSRFRRARDFVNDDPTTYQGDQRTLIIDALDEVPARADGDVVDAVLRQLRAASFPRFILSCRVADWRSATAREAVAGQYSDPPLELHLKPFDDSESIVFLAERLGADANKVVQHFRDRGLGDDFLGNPQTLELIVRVADNLPETKSELFERATEVLWSEANNVKEAASLDRRSTLDAAGAAFAAIILSGSSAIVRKGAANLAVGELTLREVEAFGHSAVERAMASRLFGAEGVDRFTYWHRRIGEYLGARWLAARADTRGKRKRLLALFHATGAVPTSLRGLHAWLALDPRLAEAVIAADPMGVIEYGDADVLAEGSGRAMLAALASLAEQNPNFRSWNRYAAKGLVREALLPDVRALIEDRETAFSLRLLLLQQLEGTAAAEALRDQLLALALDPTAYYGERSAAFDCLAGLKGLDWADLVEQLRRQASHESTRLAVEVITTVGYDDFSDEQIVETVMAHAGRTLCAIPQENELRVYGQLRLLERSLPDHRLEGVLNELRTFADALLPRHAELEDNELIDLAYAFILRRVEFAPVAAMTLWGWLTPFTEQPRYGRENRKTLADWFRVNDEIRQEIQRRVLLRKGGGKNIAQRAWRIGARSSGLALSEDDVIDLFRALNPKDHQDMRWREVLNQTRHDAEHGARAREAAKPFAGNNSQLSDWIDGLPSHRSEYEKRQDEKNRRDAGKRATQQADARRSYLEHIEAVRAGYFCWIVNPARAYLNRFRDLRQDLLPVERLQTWLGENITAAVLEGFEVFLTANPPNLSAVEIARSAAEGTYWHAQDVIVAALAERRRTGTGFADLPSERLMAGHYALRTGDERQDGVAGLSAALKDELRRRDKWRSTLILEMGPHFQKQQQHVIGLHSLMRSHEDAAVAADLAVAWLARYPDLAGEAEVELVDHLLDHGRIEDLGRLARRRVATQLTDERRRIWDAVQLLVDFDEAKKRLGDVIEPELIWHIRSRAGDRRHGHERFPIAVPQLEWIVQTFRSCWPAANHPGSSSGDANPWDASDFIRAAINRLGDQIHASAVEALASLRLAPADGYTDMIKIAQAEQRQKVADAAFVSPSLDVIRAVLDETAPQTAADLQAVILDALGEAQARLKGDPLDWYKGFFQGSRHKDEEACRDELLKLLTAIAPIGVEIRPEAHGADDKRLDIECSAGPKLMVPVEVKGQWHSRLWSAADDQLDALYASDWRAERRGIYLVLWFGGSTRITRPPTALTPPHTPTELEDALTRSCRATRDGRVVVRVLDLTRP
jgi:hypothetical protein